MNPAIGELTTVAFGWRIERRDGAGLALSSHDMPVTRDGIRYSTAPGMMPSSIKRTSGFEPSSGEVEGAISSEALTEDDLEWGRWDGAAMQLVAFDWQGGEAEIDLISGEMGPIETSDDGFNAELRGIAAALESPPCPSTTSECRAVFGSAQCGVDLSDRGRVARVVVQEDHRVRVEGAVSDDFVFGSLLVVSGPGKGWRSPILGIEGDQLVLRDRPRASLGEGCRVWLTQGCDKRFSTCVGRFANAANFRGEPHLPGNDLLVRYPGG